MTRPQPPIRGPAVWLGHTPTASQLEQMDLPFFHQAVDQLHRDTVPENYYRKVLAKRQAEAWEVR